VFTIERISMKRLLVVLTLLLPVSWCLAGCGDSTGAGSGVKKVSKQEEKKKSEEMQKEMAKSKYYQGHKK
jgi:hypothetical protein